MFFLFIYFIFFEEGQYYLPARSCASPADKQRLDCAAIVNVSMVGGATQLVTY